MGSQTFRSKLLAGEPLVGTWVKTPSYIVCDVLARTGLDTVCLDAEHAPFDRLALDASIHTLEAGDMPALVRTPSAAAEHILNALDCGTTGVVVPHVATEAKAKAVAKAARFGAGGRGYAGSTRAAGYTTKPMADNLRASQEETCVIAQIEDLEALDEIEEIAAVDGIDCLFVGRIDLTVAMGASSPSDNQVIEAVELVCEVGKKHNRRVGMFLSDPSEIPGWLDKGANLFLLGSDHGFMLAGAKALTEQFAGYKR